VTALPDVPLFDLPEAILTGLGTFICRPLPRLIIVAWRGSGKDVYIVETTTGENAADPNVRNAAFMQRGYQSHCDSLVGLLALIHYEIATHRGNPECLSPNALPTPCRPSSVQTALA